jgi:hypothetical protein
MRKISLDMDALQVESFETQQDQLDLRGTVHGNYRSQGPSFCQTECGDQCLSGYGPCENSVAWTDGEAACPCGDTLVGCTLEC